MTGAAIVLCFGVLIAVVIGETLTYQGREALLLAQHRIPALIAQYRSERGGMAGLDAYLTQRLAPLPVRTHSDAGLGRAPHLHPRWPPNGRPRGAPNANVFVRLLMEYVRPADVTYGNVHVAVFVLPSFYNRFVEYYLATMFVVAVIVIAVAWRVAVIVAANSLEPLLRTTAALNRFGDGDFTPATVSTDDTTEVGELAQAYNRAVKQITRALDERARASAEMRQFVADAGHQLRTPLTVVLGYLSAMAARGLRESDAPHVGTMLSQSRRMKSLIDELITLARLEHAAPMTDVAFDVNGIARELPQAFPPEAQSRVRVRLPSRPLYVRAAPADFGEALVALTDNALRYGGRSPVFVSVDADGAECAITVSDGGPGFSDEDLSSAFDRFYRGSASHGTVGTGLGLAIAAKAIARAGGVIRLRNLKDGGAECVIRMPLTEKIPGQPLETGLTMSA
jgi:signal transduction histidine kinase